MAKQLPISAKRLAIDKSNAQVVAVLAVAAFVSVFSLVAAGQLLSQNRYLGKVISVKQKAHSQLVANQAAAKTLLTAYDNFTAQPTNVIGGSSTGSDKNDGDNATLVLHALPSTYDFPALTSSVEKILTDRNLKVSSISGTDDEVNQQTNASSPNPQPVPMPFSFTVADANYSSVSTLISALQTSIRPIAIDSMTISGGGNAMQLTVNAHSYYQPSKSLQITKKAVK